MEVDDMTHDYQWTATQEDIRQAEARVGVKRHAVAWAVAYAQEQLGRLSPGQLLDRRHELKAFLGYAPPLGISSRGGAVKLPTDETMEATQQEFVRIIAGVRRGETVHLGRYTMTTSLIWAQRSRSPKRQPCFSQMPDLIDQPEVYQASHGLARLIDELYREGRMIKECPAPKPRSGTHERCGRWFVGRPNQTYCSPACRNLANTRGRRAKQQPNRPRRTPGQE
jgi:hypothetical protein